MPLMLAVDRQIRQMVAGSDIRNMAERGGFEPPIPETGIPVFETGAFNHSATSPGALIRRHGFSSPVNNGTG